MKVSRRLLLGGGATLGVAGWAGWSAARMAAPPSAPKDAGRVRDIDGLALETDPPPYLPPHDPELPWAMTQGSLNDASGLSRTPVFGVVAVKSREDVAKALTFARSNRLKIATAAVRHSMGGHAFDDHAVVLDMRGMNAIELDAEAKTVRVGPGATWHAIQNAIHPRFAVKAMQSTDIFSVGGSVSVNAHGMDHHAGAVDGSIRSLEIMLADGSVVACSRSENADLFRHVVGGYGLFGVILSAELEVVDNAIYRTSRALIPTADFPSYFSERIAGDNGLGLFYGHLSTAPGTLFDEMVVYRYDREGDELPTDLPPLGEPGMVAVKRLILNLSKHGAWFRDLKWYVEKSLEPKFESCTVPRTAAMAEGEACLVTRNDPMHDSVPYLFNDLKGETDILHEYFFPRAAFPEFIAGAREILLAHDANLLNASVRVVDAADIALPYATEPAFSLVLYINQTTDEAGNAGMRALTRALIDLTIEHKGRFFLPYQLHYTAAQLLASYPELPAFVAKKREYDPGELFVSTFWRAVSRLAEGSTGS
ncbi:MAG: FAD-binding oxidoreductase [Rhizobiaceae bacterium]|nr:FAD-binding oxidoreductase [Rhizobiaceae bacterium]